VSEAGICKTAILTPFGTFKFLRMPFGLQNAVQTFQRFMDSIFAELPYCFVYIDDLLLASKDHVRHQKDLEEVLGHLEKHG
jgi:cleavage and polyadenylation specificity factor subunit 1